MLGSEKLEEISGLISAVGASRKPQLMEHLEETSPEHHEALQRVLEALPTAIVKPIVECITALTDPSFGLSGHQRINQICRHLGTDPRSYREATRTLEVLASQIYLDEKLDTLTGEALQVLDDNGILGLKTADKIGRFLLSTERRNGQMHRAGTQLWVTDDKHELQDWKDLSTELRYHDTLWGPRAASEVLYKATHAKENAISKFGSTRITEVVEHRLPFFEDLIPNETLVVSEPTVVMLPTADMERAWVKVDPIPPHLLEGKSQYELFETVNRYVQLDPAFHDPALLPTLQAIYVSILAFATVVQPTWIYQMQHVSIRLDTGNTPQNYAAYRPETKTIWVSNAPLSAWAILSELAHALDDELWDPDGFASGQAGNPLANLASILRPYYSTIANKRAEFVFENMMERTVPKEPLEGWRKKPLPIPPLLEAMQIPENKRDLVDDILCCWPSLLETLPRGIAMEQLGFERGQGRGEILLLTALQEGVIQGPNGLVIDFEKMKKAFLELEVGYYLASHEVFSRFFSQYVRMYWAQNGLPFGPAVLPGDLDPQTVANLTPLFHDALMRAQILDRDHRSDLLDQEELRQKVAAILMVGTAFVVSERLL